MKRLLLAMVFAMFFLTLFGQEPYPQINNITGRSAVCLDGKWKYIVDLYKTGNQDYRAHPLPDGQSFFADRTAPGNIVYLWIRLLTEKSQEEHGENHRKQ